MLLKTPFRDAGSGHRATRFGMMLFLASLTVLFGATVVGYIVVRLQLSQRAIWPQDLPPLPRGLWGGSLVIVVSSLTMHAASVRARTDARRTRRALLATLALGGLFVGIQAACWIVWTRVADARWEDSEPWRFALTGFYLLSGLHALHVVGGLIALGWAIRRVTRLEGPRRRRLVEYTAMYWHFLAAVWLVLFGLLLAGSS